MFNVLEQTPIEIDLVAQARSTGWMVAGNKAIHEVCNPGLLRVKNYPLVAGRSYSVSFKLDSISGGYVQPFMGATAGEQYTTTGFKQVTLVASGSTLVFGLYSDADLELTLLDIQPVIVSTDPKRKSGIVWNEDDNEWPCFIPYNPDWGFSMFSNVYVYKNGELYVQRANSTERNNIFGVQYPTIVKLSAVAGPENVYYFQSIAIQANRLMITTVDGITTQLGHVSELEAQDFLKHTLDDGVTQIDVYDKEGVYSARFLRDKNVSLVSGDALKGTYLTVELTTTDTGILKLFSVAIHKEQSRIGVR